MFCTVTLLKTADWEGMSFYMQVNILYLPKYKMTLIHDNPQIKQGKMYFSKSKTTTQK